MGLANVHRAYTVRCKGQEINNVAWVCASYLLWSLSQTYSLICSVMLGLGVCKPHVPDSLASWLPLSFWQQEGSRKVFIVFPSSHGSRGELQSPSVGDTTWKLARILAL